MPSSLPTVPVHPGIAGVRRDKGFLDLTQQELYDAENWIEENGLLVTRPGLAVFGDTPLPERVMTLKQFRHPTQGLITVAATTVGLYQYNPITKAWDDRSQVGNPLGGSPTQPVVMRTFQVPGNHYLLLTNGADPPKKWRVGDPQYSDFNHAPAARTMVMVFNRIILGNLTSGPNANPQQVDVSDPYDPDSMFGGAVQTRSLSDLEGAIVHMEAMGNRAAGIFLEDGIYIAQAIEARESFGFHLQERGIRGPISASAFAVTPVGHCWIASDYSLRVWDGTRTNVFGRHVTAFLAANLSDEKRDRAWLIYAPGEIPNAGALIAGFPGRASEDVELGFYFDPISEALFPVRWMKTISAASYVDITSSDLWSDYGGSKTWSSEFAGLAWEELQSVRGRVLFGGSAGEVWEHLGGNDDGENIPHFFQTGANALGDPRQAKFVQSAFHLFDPTSASQEIDVSFPLSQRGEDPVETETPWTIDLAEIEDFESFHRARGRILAMKVSGITSERLSYRGSQVVVTARGWR